MVFLCFREDVPAPLLGGPLQRLRPPYRGKGRSCCYPVGFALVPSETGRDHEGADRIA
jgi:hypothetical protein